MTAPAALFGGAYRGRRVLVTGHTGFKGSWLVRWLLDLGAEVTGYALEPPTQPSLFEELQLESRIGHNLADVRDLEALRKVMAATQPQVVFHLAAQPLVRRSYAEPVLTFDTNVMGTVHVLEAARQTASASAVVVVTSDKCYENRDTDTAYAEDDPMGGHDPYSASKGAAELVTSSYRRSFFADGSSGGSAALVASARAGNVVGGGDWALDRILPDCARALAEDRSVAVRNPQAVRPWQHVLEPTSAYLWLGARLLRGDRLDKAWNFGPSSDQGLTVRDIVELVLAEWGSGECFDASEAGAPHEARTLRLDCGKAADMLGWRAVWDAEKAIREAARWYRAFYADNAPAEELVAATLRRYEEDARSKGAAWARAEPE